MNKQKKIIVFTRLFFASIFGCSSCLFGMNHLKKYMPVGFRSPAQKTIQQSRKQHIFISSPDKFTGSSYKVVNGELEEDPTARAGQENALVLSPHSFKEPTGIIIQDKKKVNLYEIISGKCEKKASGIVGKKRIDYAFVLKKILKNHAATEEAFIAEQSAPIPENYFFCLDGRKPWQERMEKKEYNIRSIIEKAKKRDNCHWAGEAIRKKVYNSLRTAHMDEDCGVYETDSLTGAQELVFSLFLTSSYAPSIVLATSLLKINPLHRNEFNSFIIYHELGHQKYFDALILSQDHKKEFRADHFAYVHLAKSNNLIPFAPWVIHQTHAALEKKIYCLDEDYKKSDPQSTHPAPWQRAQYAIQFLNKHLENNNCTMNTYIQNLPVEYRTLFAACLAQEFPEYIS